MLNRNMGLSAVCVQELTVKVYLVQRLNLHVSSAFALMITMVGMLESNKGSLTVSNDCLITEVVNR